MITEGSVSYNGGHCELLRVVSYNGGHCELLRVM